MRVRTRGLPLTFATVLLLIAGSSTNVSATLINGDFETGDFTGWALFTIDDLPATGTLGPSGPAVVAFDTNGNLTPSNAARLQVGQSPGVGLGLLAGGGISQDFNATAGLVSISADVAAFALSTNADGGIFQLFLDGFLLDTVNIGGIGGGTVERDTLSKDLVVAAGVHTLSITVRRGFGATTVSPFQYVDDVVVNTPSAVPEPATLWLFVLGLAGGGALWSRRKGL